MPEPQTPPPWRGGAFTGSLPSGFQVPSWVQGATPQQREADYRTYLQQNPGARGNRILHRQTGFNPAMGFQAPPARPATPAAPAAAPVPQQPGPAVGAPAPPTSGGGMPGGGMPGGGMPGFSSFDDPAILFQSMIPGMRENTTRQIGDAMAQAGFTGNRWGTSAMGKAAEIGARGAMNENALLQNTYFDWANRQQDRSLASLPIGLQLGNQQEQMAMNRFMLPFQVAQFEQGRQDQFADTAFRDWGANRLGFLPMLMQAAASQGTGSPGQIYQTQTQGSPGAIDWMTALAGLFS